MASASLTQKILSAKPPLDTQHMETLGIHGPRLDTAATEGFWGKEMISFLYLIPLLWFILRVFLRIHALIGQQERISLSYYTARKQQQPYSPTFDTTTGTGILISAAPVICYAIILWPLRAALTCMGFFTLLLILAVARYVSMTPGYPSTYFLDLISFHRPFSSPL